MASANKSYDVLISHSASDAPLALEIVSACRAGGLDAIANIELLPGANGGNALWEALAESRALLTILSPSGPTASMAIEIGAARAWNKPIYGVITDPALTRLPPALSGIQLYPVGRVDDVIESIKLSAQPLSDEDRSILARLYTAIGLPVDRFALDPLSLDELVRRFEEETGKSLSGERLLAELLRMRKQGKLTRTRGERRPRASGGAASR